MITRYAQRNLTWIDLVAPSAEEVRSLMAEFEIDPVIAQELTSPSPKSKVERRGNHLYLVLHFPSVRAAHSRPEHEIDFIVGKNFLITTRYANIDPLHSFAKAFEVNSVLNRGGAEHGGHLFIGMVRDLYHSLLLECDRLHEQLEGVEDKIFAGREREMVAQISIVGRMIHDFRRTLEPHKLMLESFEPYGERIFGQGFSYHIRSILGEYERVRHTLAHMQEWLQELRETNNSLLTTKQNDIMKNLTIMAFITFPLTLLSSLFAIDARHKPIVGMQYDFWIILGIMVVAALIFFGFFKYKKWL
jgi:magnesium transporter